MLCFLPETKTVHLLRYYVFCKSKKKDAKRALVNLVSLVDHIQVEGGNVFKRVEDHKGYQTGSTFL